MQQVKHKYFSIYIRNLFVIMNLKLITKIGYVIYYIYCHSCSEITVNDKFELL